MRNSGHRNEERVLRKLVGAVGTMNLITLYGLLWQNAPGFGLGNNSAAGLSHVTRVRGHSSNHGGGQ